MIGRDHRLAEILDEIENLLPEAAGLLGFERRDMRELADVGAGNERLVAGARQDDAAYCSVVSRILEGRSQILPGWRIQRVEHLGPIDGHIGDGALLLVQDVCELSDAVAKPTVQRRTNGVSDMLLLEPCSHLLSERTGRGTAAPSCSHKGAEASDGLADDQILHLIRAFVGVERFGIGEEARDVVVGDDAVAAQQLAAPCDSLA